MRKLTELFMEFALSVSFFLLICSMHGNFHSTFTHNIPQLA